MKKVIKADGIISNNEKIIFDTFENMLKLKKNELNENQSVKTLCNKFKSYNSKVICLLDLIGIAMVDNSFKKSERVIIYEVFDYFKIDRKNLLKYSMWSKQSSKLELMLYKFLKF